MNNPFSKLKPKSGSITEILDAPLTVNVKLDEIVVRPQLRKEFEGPDHSLANLAASIKKRGVMQAVGLWAHPTEGTYVLIYGERRCRACRMLGLTHIPAKIYRFPVEDAETTIKDYQYEENVHRKNFEQFEEAAYLQGRLDELGSIEAVLAEANISRAWFMKTMAVLNLPEKTKTLVAEGISSDKEVLYTVANIEREDPAKAEEIVDKLRDSDKSVAARKIVKEIKDRGKPEKQAKAKAKDAEQATDEHTRNIFDSDEYNAASSKAVNGSSNDILASMASPPNEWNESSPPVAPTTNPQTKSNKTQRKEKSELWLWFKKGHQATQTAPAVLQGLKDGTFGAEGENALRLAAYLSGADATDESEFSEEIIQKLL